MQNEQHLHALQSRLRARGHALSLQQIPPELFIERNGNILLDLPALCRADLGYSAVYAFIYDGSLRISVKTVDGWQRLIATATCLECAYLVPPFTHVPLELLTQSACRCKVTALLEYYLLIWATRSGYANCIRGPVYEDLEGMFQILRRTKIYADAGTRKQLDEEKAAMHGLATAAHDVRDTVENISSRKSKFGQDVDVFLKESGISREHSRTTDDNFTSLSPGDLRTRLDDTSGKAANVRNVTVEPGATITFTSIGLKRIESIALDGLCTHENIDHYKANGMSENCSTQTNSIATLQQLRNDLGKILEHLPGIDGLDWDEDQSDSRYIPLTCRVGYFKDTSALKGLDAWVFFKKISGNPAKSPNMELFVSDQDDRFAGGSQSRNFSRYCKDIEFDQEFRRCQRADDFVALTMYYFLLAKEKKVKNVEFDHRFLCTHEFNQRLTALAEKHRADVGRTNGASVSGEEAQNSVNRTPLVHDASNVNAAESERDDEVSTPAPARLAQKQFRSRPIVLSSNTTSPTPHVRDENHLDLAWSTSRRPRPPLVEVLESHSSTNSRTAAHSSSEGSTAVLRTNRQRRRKRRSSRSSLDIDTDTNTTNHLVKQIAASRHKAPLEQDQVSAMKIKDTAGGNDNMDFDGGDNCAVPRSTARYQFKRQIEVKATTSAETMLQTINPTMISMVYEKNYNNLVSEAKNIDDALQFQEARLSNAEYHQEETEEEMTNIRYTKSRNGTLQQRPATETGKILYRNGQLRLVRLGEQIRVARANIEIFERKKRENEEKIERWMRYEALEEDE